MCRRLVKYCGAYHARVGNTFPDTTPTFSGADRSHVQVDLIPEEERQEKLRRAKEDIAAQLAGTK